MAANIQEMTTAQIREAESRLGPKAREVLAYVREYYALHGHGPAYRELKAACRISTGGACARIDRLERLGLIVRRAYQAGSVRPVGAGKMVAEDLVILAAREFVRAVRSTRRAQLPEEQVEARDRQRRAVQCLFQAVTRFDAAGKRMPPASVGVAEGLEVRA